MLLVNVVGVVLAILAVGVVIYVFPMCSMQPLNSGEVEGTDVIAIKNRINNLFFIPSGEDWIVIDAGSDAKLVKQIQLTANYTDHGERSAGSSVRCIRQ